MAFCEQMHQERLPNGDYPNYSEEFHTKRMLRCKAAHADSLPCRRIKAPGIAGLNERPANAPLFLCAERQAFC